MTEPGGAIGVGAVPVGAIILAGGRASRLGGAPKPLLTVGGIGLLRGSVDAVTAAGCSPVVVVGPPLIDEAAVRWVREDPPFGGPVAAVIAALPHVDTATVLVLSTDLPRVGEAVSCLFETAAIAPLADGLCLTDDGGRPQWLTGLYRTASLRDAAERVPDAGAGASMRALLAELEIATVRAPWGVAADVDTWQDLIRARRIAGQPQRQGAVMAESSRTLPPEALDAWAASLRDALHLGNDELPVALILDLARDVANDVTRPAAPLSTFAAGLAAGRRGGSAEDIEAVVAEVTQLASTWEHSS
ncbi:MAG TPA: NTP transferase domain-containing protein [Microbacterium sp.]|uniref:NTP transferase domain-containing protein n=1 Tax=Microbacterium sp. TaxID=51671 RepID=UPI002BF8618B|nr:NTP transferase domain-containing protein [Microbacterium sp.]HWI31564.1 NTP transferase domain-containing protein [Microbacterium sp.]